jgi:tetratricopeptide (TPR) repeat protein
MSNEHFDDAILAQFAESPESLDGQLRLQIELHLRECSLCEGAVDVARSFAEALPDPETWWIADELYLEKRRTALRSFSARIAEEDREAERHLRKFVDSPYRFETAASAIQRRCRTGGAVRLLSQAAHEACSQQPLHALNLADIATQIADALPDDYYPADAVNELRGTAWKAVANANRYLARFDDGFKAADKAEQAYRRLNSAARQLGRIAYIRGLLCQKQQNYERALVFAHQASQMSDSAGDLEGFVLARNLEGGALLKLGRTDEAIDRFTSVRAAAQMMGDAKLEASAINNTGNAYLERGDWPNAVHYLLIALQRFTELRQQTEILRAQWRLAAASLGMGDFQNAERQLSEVNASSAVLGLDGDVALIKLDLAEAKLMLGDTATVRTLCIEIFAFFRQARMLTGALTAAAFLEEAAHRDRLTAKQIQHVRRFLRRLKDEPDALFVRPTD